MKILNKILFSGAIFTAAFLSGCSDDDYTPGEASNASGINAVSYTHLTLPTN